MNILNFVKCRIKHFLIINSSAEDIIISHRLLFILLMKHVSVVLFFIFKFSSEFLNRMPLLLANM